MDRINSEGIPRDLLKVALKEPEIIRVAVKNDACLLCRNRKVNEAGICQVCFTMLNDEEVKLAEAWMSGRGAVGW
ncbi:MAG: hypothetical protein KF784_06430 [Fimbriimonadaceae bacterium]|nr:hypothetical protein [Fimbriimonadaceae bacterium]